MDNNSKKAPEHFKTNVVVFVILTRLQDNKREILLQLRENTSYMCNMYDFSASGKIDGDHESAKMAALRETHEEIGVTIYPADLHLFHVRHNTGEKHIKLYFWANEWAVDGVRNGEPKVCEPDKCGGLMWTSDELLPENLIPEHREVLKHWLCHDIYSDDLR